MGARAGCRVVVLIKRKCRGCARVEVPPGATGTTDPAGRGTQGAGIGVVEVVGAAGAAAGGEGAEVVLDDDGGAVVLGGGVGGEGLGEGGAGGEADDGLEDAAVDC